MTKSRLWTKKFITGTIINFLLVLNYYLLMVIMVDYVTNQFNASSAVAGLSASIFVIGALLARFFSAQLMEKRGIRTVLLFAVLIEIVTSALYVFTANLTVLFVIRLLHGAAYGMASTAVSTIVTGSIAMDRKGEGIGYFMLSITVGAAIGPFVGMFLIGHGGYSYIFAVCTVTACICLLAGLSLKDKNVVKSGGLKEKTIQQQDNYSGLERLFEKRAIAISGVCAGIYFCYSSIISFLTPYANAINLQTAATFFFIVYSIAILITRPFTGRLFDRKGARTTMIPAFLSFFVGMILLSRAQNGVVLLVSAALLGFGIGVIQSSGLAVAVQNSPVERISYANSTFYIFWDIGTGAGPFFLGFLVEPLGYRGMYLVIAGLTVVFFALFLVVCRKRTHNQKVKTD